MQPLPESERVAIDAELEAGRKLQAIKRYRDATGCGLAEAKAAIESREVALGGRQPDQFAPVESSGCVSGAVGVLLVLTALIVLGFLALIFLKI